ncbi:MAG: hypothetical protein SA339_11045 [Methanomassiliicoccus sp.]|nr:hypothetical protein [Methanomassiliicoccus sp.]
MSDMVDIKCPICGERLMSRNQDELTQMLRGHLADTHQISRISEESRGRPSQPESMRDVQVWSMRDPSALTPEETRQREEVVRLGRSAPGTQSMTERQVETWNRGEPTGETPRSATTIQETEQWRYPREETREEREVGTWRSDSRYQSSEEGMTGRSGMAGVRHGGGMMHRMMNRGEMRMAMDCPLCGRPVYGSNDDDLSDEMRFHFKDYHQIRRR